MSLLNVGSSGASPANAGTGETSATIKARTGRQTIVENVFIDDTSRAARTHTGDRQSYHAHGSRLLLSGCLLRPPSAPLYGPARAGVPDDSLAARTGVGLTGMRRLIQ